MLTYNDIKRSGADALTRAYCKHLIAARDKWYLEAEQREEMEQAADLKPDWSLRAKAHADKLDQELRTIVRKIGMACVHGHKKGTPAGDLHRECARMGSV